MKYKVIKQHYGDKQYFAGEEREVTNENDAEYLIKQGLIAKKSETTQNKAEKAPQNKAERTPRNKK